LHQGLALLAVFALPCWVLGLLCLSFAWVLCLACCLGAGFRLLIRRWVPIDAGFCWVLGFLWGLPVRHHKKPCIKAFKTGFGALFGVCAA
jgi:hypothetical protein